MYPEPSEGHFLLPTLQLFSQAFGGGKKRTIWFPFLPTTKPLWGGGGGCRGIRAKVLPHLCPACTLDLQTSSALPPPTYSAPLEAFLGPPGDRACSPL